MGLWDKLTGEFIDVIEWTDSSSDTMVYRFERYGNEIKYGAKLTVREGQAAVFVNEGVIADVFEPGMYELETNNLPILSTLQGWVHNFESPFKAEVYFFSTRQFVDLKWGTRNPIMLRDPEFGPVRLRAYGTYVIRIEDPVKFLRQIVGTDGFFTTDEVTDQLRNLAVSRFATILGESQIPLLDLAANYDDLSKFITAWIGPEFMEYGLQLTKLLVENVSLPDAVEEALDRRTSMGIVGNLRDYAAFQAAEAMRAAAENPGGDASAGVGMGMGFAMAQKLGETLGNIDEPTAAAPPPVPGAGERYFVAVEGRQTGPFGVDEIKQKAIAGEITRETLVWRRGMSNWAAAAKVQQLAEVLDGIPPPVPGA
ncbi:MAG: SPFH domain-containing protein [Gammaproteobacteria bacterium]